MNKKTLLIVLGIALIFVQIISWTGMSRMYVGLYPDNNDLLYHNYSTGDSGLNIKKVLFAIEAGVDRFNSGFEDLTYERNDYRVMTSTQMTSAMVRESLGCSKGGGFDLFIYDTILTISYYFAGLLGFTLIVTPLFISKREQHRGNRKIKKLSAELKISADIPAHCEGIESNDHLMDYLQTCVKMGHLTQEQSIVLFEAYKNK